MVFMHRLILGVLLILIYSVDGAEVQRNLVDLKSDPIPPHNNNDKETKFNTSTSKENETANSDNETKASRISDADIENIVKPFKFLRTSPRNVTTLKLKKSESYTTTTTQKYPEGSRNGSGRSVDIDIEKYISPDFYNAVYTLPTSSEGTRKSSDEEDANFRELTTPKTPFFDRKYKETVESVNQKLEAESSLEVDNGTNSFNHTSDNFIEEVEKNPNGTRLAYKDYHNLEFNNETTPDQKGYYHSETVRERQKTLNFESIRNDSKAYDEKNPSDDTSNELLKDNIKYLLGDENNEVKKEENNQKPFTEVSDSNNHFSTRHHAIIKPSTDKSDSLISNKIESETTIRSQTNTETTSSKPKTTLRGSIKFADYQINKNNDNRSSSEPIVQENQIVPVQAAPPLTSFETTTNENKDIERVETTINVDINKTRHATEEELRKNRTEPDEQQSTTVLIFVRPDDVLEATTMQEDYLGTTAIPRGFRLDTTSKEDDNDPTEYVIDTTDKTHESIIEEYTTIIPDLTTSQEEIQTQFDAMYKDTPNEEITTTEVASTTVNESRFSKDIKFEDTTTTFAPSETTIISETTAAPAIETTTTSTEPNETTSVTINDEETAITTKQEKLKQQITTETIRTTTTEQITTILTYVTNEEATPEEVTNKAVSVVEASSPTKTLLENQTSENDKTVVEEANTTPTTSINFVHIKNIDRNHTTLLPDILKPNEIYTTPSMEKSTKTATTTEATANTDETTGHAADLDGPTGSGATIAIVISCIGGICLIALACLLVVMRNRQKRFNYGQRCRPVSLDDYSVDNVSVFNSVRRKANARASKRSYGNPAFEDPVCLTHPLTFPAISKFASNLEDVTSEFAEIPQIIARTSELPEGCEIKNRYANVIPLPESRVYLTNLDGYSNSDYINANFVTGPKNTRKYYIACQGPMSNTVDDFWRMIWEQQCKVILMLTHLFENGVEKCYDYLPPSEVLDCHRLFGDFQITLKKREVKEKYIISSIQLKNMVSNSWREVTHFWYMGWPEKGVPTEANSIIAFLIEARSYMKSGTIDKKTTLPGQNGESNNVSSANLHRQGQEVNPVVVHCSPGTGRTGVVITCDIAIREFEQTRQVDIPKIVYRIRRDRASAVQTKDQYAFIYKVINLYATKLAGGSLESI